MLDKIEKGEQRRQFGGGDDGVGTLKTRPRRVRAWRARRRKRALGEAGAAGEPYVLGRIERAGAVMPLATQRGLLPRRDDADFERAVVRLLESGRDRRLVHGPQRWDVGVVAHRDLGRMPNSETCDLALALQIPERLVRLAQARQGQIERGAVVITDVVLRRPSV